MTQSHQYRRRHGRKERVLHTRVSDELSDDIRKLAEDLRVPVSNLVRNVLEEAFSVVERVSGDMGEVIDDVLAEAEGARDRARERMARRRHRRSHRRYGYDASEFQHDAEAEPEPETAPDEGESLQTVSESERAVDDPAGAAERDTAEGSDPARFEDVIGWQPLLLNRAIGCAGCATRIERGAQGYVGVTAQGLSPSTLCESCVRGL